MALDLRLDTADVLALRFARSPLWETMQAPRVVREPSLQAYHLSWLRGLDLTAVADAAAVLAPLVPRPGTQPDFLIPIPTGPTTTADDDLAAVAATPLEVVERELRAAAENPRAKVRTGVLALLADPAAALRSVVSAQRVCWEQLMRPFWSEIDDLLASDIAARAAELATSGLEAVLGGLSSQIAWTGAGLRITTGTRGDTTDLRRRGLVVMPSVFAWPAVVAVTDPPWQPTVVYPPAGWAHCGRPDEGGRPAPSARCSAPRAPPCCAGWRRRRRRACSPAASASACRPSRRTSGCCGLVTSRRAGREVLRRRTALGAALCD